jgi:acetoin utilization deacetylase AcuC-like enzyme
MKPTGIVRDSVYLKHDMGLHHPENPRRLEVLYSMVDEAAPDLNLQMVPVREATIEEIALNHDVGYVEDIASTAGKSKTFLDPDTSTSADSWNAASRAVGGVLNLVEQVLRGELRNGFALVRPPGHHALRRRAMGFCLFNNIALAAKCAIENHGAKRVAIVDWDLHHGNGTQNSFYNDSQVLFISTHQHPHYPGTGSMDEVGSDGGEGYTVNVPMPPGAGDAEYLAIFHRLVGPVLESYEPDLILVSAGFDAHLNDPLGGMRLTDSGYGQMMRFLMHLAGRLSSGKIILALEGGYDLDALRDASRKVLFDLSNYEPDNGELPPEPSSAGLTPVFKNKLNEILEIHRKYWPNVRPIED